MSSSSDANVSTPNSSECDEGVTIHADPTAAAAAADEGVQTSPSVNKETSKSEAQ